MSVQQQQAWQSECSLVRPETLFFRLSIVFGCTLLKSTWWQLKAATSQNSSSASTVECVTRNRPQLFIFHPPDSSSFSPSLCFVTAVNAELFLSSSTLWHSVIVKIKSGRPWHFYVPVCTFPRLAVFLPFFHFMMCIPIFPVVSPGPMCKKGRRGSETPTWPLVRVVILDQLLTELREWSDVPRKAVQQPQVGSNSPWQTWTQTRGQCNSIKNVGKSCRNTTSQPFISPTKEITIPVVLMKMTDIVLVGS